MYAGAVMVLFLFVIMLLNLQPDPAEAFIRSSSWAPSVRRWDSPQSFWTVVRGWSASAPAPAVLAPDFGTTAVVARNLFTDHMVAFELTSVLLLVAVVGAVVLARRDRG